MNDIIVEVAGVEYTFKPLKDPFKEMKSNHLIIIQFGKRNAIKQVWMCGDIVNDATQQHMESILVRSKSKQLTKNHGMVRVSHIDDSSISLRGPDPKNKGVDLVVMGDKGYAVNRH